MPTRPDIVKCVVNCECQLGESPVWSATGETLYWLDISLSSVLYSWRPSTGEMLAWPIHELATGMVLSASDELVILSEAGISIFDPGRRALRRIVTPPFSMHGMRFNDCGCDRLGRLWTGTMLNDLANCDVGSSQPGALYRFDPDLSCHRMDDGFACPNTFVWTLDDRTLLTADSGSGSIFAYDYDIASGRIVDRRLFAHPENLGIPDGSAMDEQGYLWNARWGAGCIARFAPDGSLNETVEIPADFVTSCAFGGPALDTLFVTTARGRPDQREATRQPLAGGIFAFSTRVPGIAASRYQRDVAQGG